MTTDLAVILAALPSYTGHDMPAGAHSPLEMTLVQFNARLLRCYRRAA